MAVDGLPAAAVARELARSEERIRSILDCAYNAYVAIDDQGLVIDWNHQAAVTFGYAREEALGRAIADLIIPVRYRPAHWAGLRRFLTTGEGPVLNQRLELEALHRDGHEFPVDLTIWPLRVENTWTFHAFILDATQRKEAQRQALINERQAAVGQFITLLTQESRNPLQRIQMWSEMLALELQNSPAALRAIDEIQKAQTRLERLMIDVRGYAAPLKLKPRDINLRDVWNEAWRQVRQLQAGRIGELHEDLDEVESICHADPQAMEQVFYHLLDSAVARAGESGRISIHCSVDLLGDKQALRVAVRDNGNPLSRAERSHIEHGGAAAWPPEASATGGDLTRDLGMVIVGRILEAHGGRVVVGAGDTFGNEVILTVPK
jgi:PAS domain S-box-containing protein